MPNNLRAKADDAFRIAKEKATDAAAMASDTVTNAANLTKETADKAVQITADRVANNPIVALMGGLAIGAIAAALLPRTQREDNAIGGVGTKVRETAANAAKAARDAGKDQLDTLGLTKDGAKEQFRDIAKKIGQAAATASSAAGDTLKKR